MVTNLVHDSDLDVVDETIDLSTSAERTVDSRQANVSLYD